MRRIIVTFFIILLTPLSHNPALAYGDKYKTLFFDALSPSQQKTLTACNVSEDEFARQMLLSTQDFDQDFSGGWRQVANTQNCKLAALILIKQYILMSPNLVAERLRLLRWHAGQLAADMNSVPEAVNLFLASKNKDGDENARVWNLYVDATVAFMMKDKARLQSVHDKLAAVPVSEQEKAARRAFLEANPKIRMPAGFVDKPQNLDVVERLIRCFEYEYSVAYPGKCEN